MSTLTRTRPAASPLRPGARASVVIVPLQHGLSRVTRPDGEVLGYVEAFESREGERYRAKRVSPRLRDFVTIGEFWQRDEAVDCFTRA